jgi:hypothetical protein
MPPRLSGAWWPRTEAESDSLILRSSIEGARLEPNPVSHKGPGSAGVATKLLNREPRSTGGGSSSMDRVQISRGLHSEVPRKTMACETEGHLGEVF